MNSTRISFGPYTVTFRTRAPQYAGVNSFCGFIDSLVLGRDDCRLDFLFGQMRRSAAFLATLELPVALPDHPAVFIGRVPDLGAVETATLSADDL